MMYSLEEVEDRIERVIREERKSCLRKLLIVFAGVLFGSVIARVFL